jgi:adenosine deaminase
MSNIIATLPKVDLCRDFAASVSGAHLRERAGKKGAKLTTWRTFDSVKEFRRSLAAVRKSLNAPGHFEQAAVHILENLIERSIVHTEFHVDPLASNVPIDKQLARIENGYEIVADEYEEALVSFGFILELDRGADPAAQRNAIDAAIESSKRVLGVAFVGPETALNKPQLELAEYCRSKDLRLIISAGYEPGSKGIHDAVALKVDRVLHGFGVLKHNDALTQLRARRTPFVCTPTIEVQSGRAKSYARHPIAKMAEAGLFCTFASGAPVLFSGSLTSEFEHLSVHLGWRLDQLRNSTLRAIEAGFIEPKLRYVVARAVENWRHRPRLTAGGDDDGFGM